MDCIGNCNKTVTLMAGLTIQQDVYQGCDVRNVDHPIFIDITTLVFQNALVKLLSFIDDFTAFDN